MMEIQTLDFRKIRGSFTIGLFLISIFASSLTVGISYELSLSDPTISFSPAISNVTVGQQFSVDVVIDYAEKLYGFEVWIGFDDTKLNAESISYMGYLNEPAQTWYQEVNNTGGYVAWAQSSRNPATGKTGGSPPPLARINFTSIGTGTSQLHFFNTILSDDQARSMSHQRTDGQVSAHALSQYTLTINTNGSGSVDKNPDQTNYTWGTNVSLAATPVIGWSFAGWGGDASGSVSPTTVNMTGNKAVDATFTQNVYTLTVSAVGNGSVNLNNSGPYHYGDVVQLTAVPAVDWNFHYWSGGLTGSANPATLVVSGDLFVTANFITRPRLIMNPSDETCRRFSENFAIQINVTNASDVDDFRFEVRFNATLLDIADVSWNMWTGTYTVDAVNGILTGFGSGSPISGNVTLLTITFNATYHHMWKDESTVFGWKNIQTGTVYFQWANLSYPSSPDLGYERGGLNQIDVDPDFAYIFSPIQGDIDNNGQVDVFDLRTVGAFYDTANPDYNLTGDSTIDIYDLVVIGSNFGFTYP